MDHEPPWSTCFLTRMLILHLAEIGKDTDLDYAAILRDEDHLRRIENPKAFLLNCNNWVPHSVLKNLIGASEKATGCKEITYLAARRFFRHRQAPSFLEIIAKFLNSMEEALYCSNLWATGYANYLKLGCLTALGADQSDAILLSQFGPHVEPLVGNFNFIRGNYEALAGLFGPIEEALCLEEISQLKLESLSEEFAGYTIEKSGGDLFILETASGREVVAAKRVYLRSEAVAASDREPVGVAEVVGPPNEGKLNVITPRVEEDLKLWTKQTQVYQIVHEGTLYCGPLQLTLPKGKFFNAPYSRYRFRWRIKADRSRAEISPERSELIPLLFDHLRELRETLREILHCTMENKELSKANRALHGMIQKESEFFGIIGKSPTMQLLFEQVRLISRADSTVLILGETGTGKELLARALHQASSRRDRNFVAINCAALSESLLEAELFGYEKGAFTGAFSMKKGIFETAHGGTLFLDEIGEISLAMQAKLLRVLEEREIRRVGGRETISIDVRVISATNRNLEEQITQGKFRSDLFYRLHVISLVIPPLRERTEDLLLLVDHYLAFFSEKCKKEKPQLSPQALTLLMNHPWPGNIRQLKNVIERGVVLDRDQLLMPEDLILPAEEPSRKESAEPRAFHNALHHYKRSLIEEALKETGGNQTKAAERLGLQRTYLARLIRLLNISSKS